MLAMRLPRPMSVSSRAVRLPVKRSSFSHRWLGRRRLRGRLFNALGAQRLGQQLLAQFAATPLLQVFRWWRILERARPVRTKFSQPGWAGAGRGDDLDHVAALELGAQRHRLAIDLGGHAVVAHVAVDGVGEVHRRGAARQRQDLALGREHVDRVGEQVDLDVLPGTRRVAGLVLDVEQRLQPLAPRRWASWHAVLGRLGRRLVEPVRGDAGLGHRVHGLGADLELHRRAQRAHQRGVQRLVAVGLGDGDVVLEAPGTGLYSWCSTPSAR
jgi:hypothetical protein